MQIDSERLAYWYLRLNGFLTIENFIVHDEGGGPQRTDADVVAIRLPYRQEGYHLNRGYGVWMEDDPRFSKKQLPFAAFVEVATDRCKLNGPWTDPKKANMERALNALGALPSADNEKAAAAMYDTGSYRSSSIELGLISIGSSTNGRLTRKMPNVVQITWDEVKEFIFARFHRWEDAKRGHPQWDPDGHRLWHLFRHNRDDQKQFASSIVFTTPERRRAIVKLIREGTYFAEVPVELIEDDTAWSPYFSPEDAQRLDAVRLALSRGDLSEAAKHGHVYELKPIAAAE